ncbi:MAG: hypothetical protein ACLFMT_01035 [Halobacteriales archaeon]
MASTDRTTEASCRELTEYVRSQAHDALRTVFYYEGADGELLYVRPDVAGEVEDGVERMHGFLRDALEDRSTLESICELGLVRGSVRILDDGFLLHFPLGDDSGWAITVDRHGGRKLPEIVDYCRNRLRELR